jgi:hypothetical protein
VRDDSGAKWLYWHRTTPSATGWMGDIDIDPFDSDHVLYVTGQGVWGTSDRPRRSRRLRRGSVRDNRCHGRGAGGDALHVQLPIDDLALQMLRKRFELGPELF